MEKITTLILVAVSLCIASFDLHAQEAKPMDIPTLEILIDAHKAKYDKLDKRVLEEVAKLGATKSTKKLSEQYEELQGELSKRYNSALAWTSVGLSALRLAKDIRRSYDLLKTFGTQVKYVKNIYVLREYTTAVGYLAAQYEYLNASVKKLPLMRADPQSLSQVVLELQTRVTAINYYLYQCNYMVQGYKLLEEAKYSGFTPIDKAKIATQIIKDFSK